MSLTSLPQVGALRLPSPRSDVPATLSTAVALALRGRDTTRLSAAPTLPANSKKVVVEVGWGHSVTAYAVGTAVYVQRVSQRLGPADQPLGAAKTEWFKLNDPPSVLKRALGLEAATPRTDDVERPHLARLAKAILADRSELPLLRGDARPTFDAKKNTWLAPNGHELAVVSLYSSPPGAVDGSSTDALIDEQSGEYYRLVTGGKMGGSRIYGPGQLPRVTDADGKFGTRAFAGDLRSSFV